MRSFLAYASVACLLLGLGSASPFAQQEETPEKKPHHHTRPTHLPTGQPPAPTNGPPGAQLAAPEQGKHPVDKKFFARMVRYARFTAASGVTGQCPSPPGGSTSVAYIDKQSTDTQARVFRDEKAKEIIISFPGTNSDRDEDLDSQATPKTYTSPGVNCPGCLVHTGFLTAWNSVAKQAHDIVARAVQQHQGYKVVLTGHSLGAAIATLGFASFKGQGIPVKAVYTYGSPRVGNKKFAAYIDKLSGVSPSGPGNVYRITHAGDPITQQPGTDAGYVHVKTEFWQSGKNKQTAKTTYRCYGNEPAGCVNGHVSGDINDHLHYSNLDFTKPTKWCNT